MAGIKVEDLSTKFQQALDEKWGYIWGTSGKVWTAADQAAATRTITVQHGSKWIGKKVADCSGLFSWAFKQLGGYMYHGSNTMWNKYCTKKGSLASIDPETLKPGTALFINNNGNRGHVGYYMGNNVVIEARGTIKGVITSRIDYWDEWGLLKGVDYPEGSAPVSAADTKPDAYFVPPAASEEPISGYETVRLNDKNTTVKLLQKMLNDMGEDLSVDGIFGKKTLAAVKKFQEKMGLEVDGVVGNNTWAVLESKTNDVQQLPDFSTAPGAKEYTLEQKVDILWYNFQNSGVG